MNNHNQVIHAFNIKHNSKHTNIIQIQQLLDGDVDVDIIFFHAFPKSEFPLLLYLLIAPNPV